MIGDVSSDGSVQAQTSVEGLSPVFGALVKMTNSVHHLSEGQARTPVPGESRLG